MQFRLLHSLGLEEASLLPVATVIFAFVDR